MGGIRGVITTCAVLAQEGSNDSMLKTVGIRRHSEEKAHSP